MKIIHIALKDLTRSMRSTFAVLFMFGVPLLVTGMFYFMFGNTSDGEGGFDLPVSRVVVVNLDEGSPDLQMGSAMIGMTTDSTFDNLGELITLTLNDEAFGDYLSVTSTEDTGSARDAVDANNADVAVIIPEDFSSKFTNVDSFSGQSEVEFYIHPEKILEAGILQSILQQFFDTMSGAKIAAGVAANHLPAEDYVRLGDVVQRYIAESKQDPSVSQKYITVESVTDVESSNTTQTLIGPIMAGMMIFYAFYTGMTTAESILREDEEGTLPRLFTTPTSRTLILAGKFTAVLVTVFVQVVVLIIAAKLIFQIQWGHPANVALIAVGTVLAASAFGVFANSLIKSTKQGGIIYGGVLTVTGMLGMIKIFTLSVPNTSPAMETISLLVPQGWAIRGFFQSSTAVFSSDILITFGILLLWTVIFFSIGAWRFHRRFA